MRLKNRYILSTLGFVFLFVASFHTAFTVPTEFNPKILNQKTFTGLSEESNQSASIDDDLIFEMEDVPNGPCKTLTLSFNKVESSVVRGVHLIEIATAEGEWMLGNSNITLITGVFLGKFYRMIEDAKTRYMLQVTLKNKDHLRRDVHVNYSIENWGIPENISLDCLHCQLEFIDKSGVATQVSGSTLVIEN